MNAETAERKKRTQKFSDLLRFLRFFCALKIEGVCADALYDSCKNREYLKSVGIKAYIPPKTKGSEAVRGKEVNCKNYHLKTKNNETITA